MSKITKMMLLANQSKSHNRDYDRDSTRYAPDRQRDYGAMDGYRHYKDYQMHDPMMSRSRHQRMDDYDRYDDPEDYGNRDRPHHMKHRESYDDWDDYAHDYGHKRGKSDWDEDYPEHIDESKAREWIMKMRNADGSQGAHFAPEASEQLRAAHCPDCDRWDFFATVNMMHSDYCPTLKKLGMDKPEVYACLSKAFLCDDDAKPGKLARYMKYIPK